jgi:hypothetical protein
LAAPMLLLTSMTEPRRIWNQPTHPPMPEPQGSKRVMRLLVQRWTVHEFEVPLRMGDRKSEIGNRKSGRP